MYSQQDLLTDLRGWRQSERKTVVKKDAKPSFWKESPQILDILDVLGIEVRIRKVSFISNFNLVQVARFYF